MQYFDSFFNCMAIHSKLYLYLAMNDSNDCLSKAYMKNLEKEEKTILERYIC
ncbi:hypothetical protein EUBDOL_00148 [Amedibacillus dolichus DSM 3991]|uniref:Uncharacterized protein n=1 Tax=Amedibacillus dolichus DSM 3991 TaxID=428127 RepID=A8R815_9FIRM|nr:hypothetical protein EUBDOL_00148 [Amedibacillus dolichus DSM 3991]